jgi:hypothetical protein
LKIKVEGTEYEFPTVDSLTMDETILLERVAGVGVEEIIPGESMPMGAVKAFVMIAVMRARPEVKEREIAEAIGKIKLTELDELIQKEDDAGPPAIAPRSGDSMPTSGAASNGASESSLAAVPLPSTGVPPSPTSATSDPETSAA